MVIARGRSGARSRQKSIDFAMRETSSIHRLGSQANATDREKWGEELSNLIHKHRISGEMAEAIANLCVDAYQYGLKDGRG